MRGDTGHFKSSTHQKISYLDFLIRRSITDTRIEFIQWLPSQLGMVQVLYRTV